MATEPALDHSGRASVDHCRTKDGALSHDVQVPLQHLVRLRFREASHIGDPHSKDLLDEGTERDIPHCPVVVLVDHPVVIREFVPPHANDPPYSPEPETRWLRQ